MRPMRFLNDSLKRLREFPEDVRQDAGDPLEKVQKQAQATSPRDVEVARNWTQTEAAQRCGVIVSNACRGP